jgi:serine/threonine protein kinase
VHIHQKGYIHRDLKPENILLKIEDKRLVAKVADFGLSATHRNNRIFTESTVITNEQAGTIIYMPPEQALEKSYGKKVDLWAAGIILHKLLTGRHPFHVHHDTEISYVSRITNTRIQIDSSVITPLAESLLVRLCARNVRDRYSAVQALNHPWVSRNLEAPVPLTQDEEQAQSSADRNLRRAQQVVIFLSISQKSGGNRSFDQGYLDLINKNSSSSSTGDDIL